MTVVLRDRDDDLQQAHKHVENNYLHLGDAGY